MKKQKKIFTDVGYQPRFSPLQIRYASDMEADADLSFSDGANEVTKPGKARRGGKVQTAIENTKPEL